MPSPPPARCRPRPCPSRSATCRGKRAAISGLWVITTRVIPSALSSSSSPRWTRSTVESRLPVGSSASTSAGRPTTARATATRWRSPPESLLACWCMRWPRPDPLQGVGGHRAPLGGRPARVEQAVGHVVQGGLGVEQVELLEDEADALRAQRRQLAVGHPAHVEAAHLDPARGGPVEGAHDVEQGRLARPRGPDHAHQFSGIDPEVDAAQGGDRGGARVDPGHPAHLQDRAHGTTTRSPACRPAEATSTRLSA